MLWGRVDGLERAYEREVREEEAMWGDWKRSLISSTQEGREEEKRTSLPSPIRP